MEMLVENRWVLAVPVVLFLVWVARKDKKSPVQQPAPVAPVEPQQPENAGNKSAGNFLDIMFVICALVIAYFWWTGESNEAYGIAATLSMSATERIANLGGDPLRAIMDTTGSGQIGLEWAWVLLVVAFVTWVLGSRSK